MTTQRPQNTRPRDDRWIRQALVIGFVSLLLAAGFIYLAMSPYNGCGYTFTICPNAGAHALQERAFLDLSIALGVLGGGLILAALVGIMTSGSE